MTPAGATGPADDAQIRFDDGAAYEEFMGAWSRLAGDTFLRWLAPPEGLRCIDVGCGNGAFTNLLTQRCTPREVQGIDPSQAQIDFARGRIGQDTAHFRLGGAESLPFADATFDAAVMALVIFFVPDPARGVAEMARVVRPGGSVSAYAWDFVGGGFPFAALHDEMAALGMPPLWPPSAEAAGLEMLRSLWEGGGLVDVETRSITVQRSFADFDTWWRIARTGPRIAPRVDALPASALTTLETRLRARLPADADGRITYSALANAVKGRVPTP